MSRIVAILTSDPMLVRCELDRVRPQLSFDDPSLVAGVGAYEDGVVLQRRYGTSTPRVELWDVPDSDAVVFHAGALAVGQSLEENAQPFRFRQWLFAHLGAVEQAERVRDQLLAELPDFLQRSVRGSTLSEVVFGIFLSELRAVGRTEDPNLEPAIAAQLLLKTCRAVEQATSGAGGAQKPQQAMVATNGRLLVAARRGAPLSYTLLEGEAACARCGLTADGKDTDPLVRDHRRRRSVVLATHPARAEAWVAVPDGGALAVDRKLAIQVL